MRRDDPSLFRDGPNNDFVCRSVCVCSVVYHHIETLYLCDPRHQQILYQNRKKMKRHTIFRHCRFQLYKAREKSPRDFPLG